MEETTKKTTITFHEFIGDTKPLSNEESWIAAFADYFLKYFDTFKQMASETGISEAELNAMFSFKLKFIDKVKYQEVMEKNGQNKIAKVADYIIETGASTRKAALEFGVSNATISEWMTNKLPLIDSDRYKEYLKVKEKNTEKSTDDVDVVKRIKAAVDLIVIGNLTINEVAEALHTTPMTIARDLEKRLPRLSAEDIEDIGKEKITKLAEVLKFHSASHPRKQSKK